MNRLVTLALLATVTGCGLGPADVIIDAQRAPTPGSDNVAEPTQAPAGWDASRLFTAIADGRMRGTIGETTVDAAPDIADVYDDGSFTQLAVYAKADSGRRVMLQLSADMPLVPGTGSRFRPQSRVVGLACQGSDSGDPAAPFASTSYDEAACEVAMDAEQDADNPQALRVHVAATLPLGRGTCLPPDDAGEGCVGEMASTGALGCAEVALPDLDGDGDGDLGDEQQWDAEATFLLLRQ